MPEANLWPKAGPEAKFRPEAAPEANLWPKASPEAKFWPEAAPEAAPEANLWPKAGPEAMLWPEAAPEVKFWPKAGPEAMLWPEAVCSYSPSQKYCAIVLKDKEYFGIAGHDNHLSSSIRIQNQTFHYQLWSSPTLRNHN